MHGGVKRQAGCTSTARSARLNSRYTAARSGRARWWTRRCTARAREHALQQLKERQEPALKPLVPDGWTARWSAENTQWYFIKQGGEVVTWDRPPMPSSHFEENKVTEEDFARGVAQAAAGVGDATAATEFTKLHQLWAASQGSIRRTRARDSKAKTACRSVTPP